MLNINTQARQKVIIGDNQYWVQLIDFSEDAMSVRVQNIATGAYDDHTIGAGKTLSICESVQLCFIGTGWAGHRYAILGFEAPRSIAIRGAWKNDSRAPLDSGELEEMSDTSLVYYGTLNGKTPLERELLRRFKKVVSARQSV